MGEFGWREFMEQWSSELLQSPLADAVPAELGNAGQLGRAGATDQELAEAEKRLKIALPPSYKAFLRFSNGWGPTEHAINQLWPVRETGWFAKLEPDWIAAYTGPSSYGPPDDPPDEEYYSYGERFSSFFKSSHLKHCLQITPVGDSAVYLLNPQAITADGEWEAWFLANWLPGALRYRSFQELMIGRYHSFAGREWRQPEGVIGGLPQQFSAPPGSPRRKSPVTKKKRERTTEELLAAIGRPDLAMKLFPSKSESMFMGPEEKAMRRLYRELAKRKEDQVSRALRERLPIEQDWQTREEIIDALGELRDENSVELLFSSLQHGQSVNEPVCAMHALKHMAPERLGETLLAMIGRRSFLSFAATCMVLAEIREMRAIPMLKEIANEGQGSQDTTALQAVKVLSQFGEEGCTALLELSQSPEAQTRGLAAAGLLYCNDPRVESAVTRLANDPEPLVRRQAEGIMQCLRPAQRARRK